MSGKTFKLSSKLGQIVNNKQTATRKEIAEALRAYVERRLKASSPTEKQGKLYKERGKS